MKTYKAYTRSIGIAIVALIGYLFVDLIVFGILLDRYPDMRARYVLLVLTALVTVAYYFAMFTSRGKLSVKINGEAIVWRPLRKIHLYPDLDKVIRFSDISHYKCLKRRFRGDAIRLYLNDGSKLFLSEQLAPLIRLNGFTDMVNDILSGYERSLSGPPVLASTTAEISDRISAASTGRSFIFYFIVVIILFFYFGFFGSFFLILFLEEHNFGIICLSLLGFGVGIYSLWVYFKATPKVRVDQDAISFNKREKYIWADVVAVELSGKQPFKYFKNYPMEGIRLQFRNGKVKHLYDSMYTNLWQIKNIIKVVMERQHEGIQTAVNGAMLNLNETAPAQKYPVITHDIRSEHFDYYKGNQFISFTGILCWIVVGFFILFATQLPEAWVLFLFLGLLFFGLFSSTMNYFGVSESFIVVKNCNLLWRKKVYMIRDIQEVLFDDPNKSFNAFTIIFKNYKKKSYFGSTLRENDWFMLVTRLKNAGVSVRDENHFVARQTKGMKKATKMLYWYFGVYMLITCVSITFIVTADMSDNMRLLFKILWVGLVILLGIFGLRYSILRAAKMADRIDKQESGQDDAPNDANGSV